jgi:hypothetical protein
MAYPQTLRKEIILLFSYNFFIFSILTYGITGYLSLPFQKRITIEWSTKNNHKGVF